MKNFLKSILLFGIAGMMFAACSELSLSETELKFPAGFFEKKSFVVKTDLNWDIVEKPNWVSLSKIEENGRTIVEVSPYENHSFDSRMGKIKIQTAEKFYIVDLFQDGVKLKKESGDLGLSVEWSTCNLGATKSTDFGNYYKWDEIHDYQSNGYRLPTHEEQVEFRDNIFWVWGENNGVEGIYCVAKNGNYVFLPAAGGKINCSLYSYNCRWKHKGEKGYYWSSSLYKGGIRNAHTMEFGWELGYCHITCFTEAPRERYWSVYYYDTEELSVRLVRDVK